MIPLLAFLRSLLFATAAFGDAARDDLEESFTGAVDPARLLRTVRELVALGARMGGTPSGEVAATYHAERFRAAGLEPRIATDPEVHAFQTLKLAATLIVGDQERALTDGCLALSTPGVAATRLPLVTGLPPPDAKLAAEYALLIDEAERRAAIALPESRAPRVLLVGCKRRVDSSTPVLHQPRGYPRTLLTMSAREVAWWREQAAVHRGAGSAAPQLAIAAEVFDGMGAPKTALADLPAKDPDAPILLYCAHGDSDSGSPGADDNASGDAVVLELATVFAELRKEGLELPFTLRFAVWGAEIHSSGAYFRQIRADGSAARHLAVINFDQAGTGAERDCIYIEPDNLELNEPLVRAGLELAGDYCGTAGFWTEYTSNAALGGTDSYVFSPGWNRGGAKGDLPSITIFTAAFGTAERTRITPGFEPAAWDGGRARRGGTIVVDYSRVYHETGDRPEVTTEAEPWNMPWVTKAAGLLALRLARAPEVVKKLLDR